MKKTVYIIAAIWTLITLGIFMYNEIHLAKGQEVLLKVIPYDPRDFLRGDYVTLNYEINNIETSGKRIPKVNYEKPVYVILKKDAKGVASATDITYLKPENRLFIKGQLAHVRLDRDKEKVFYRIQYNNIERFYVKEGKARKLEKSLQRNGGYAKIYLTRSGNARIKEIIENK